MERYRRELKSLESLSEEEKEIESTKKWLDSCRHIDENIDHERAVLLYHFMRIKQIEALSLAIEKVLEEIGKGGTGII